MANTQIKRIGYSCFAVLFLLASESTCAEIANIEHYGLTNKAGLGVSEMKVLDKVISLTFAQLPKDQFQIVFVQNQDTQPDCDNLCLNEMAKERGTTWLLLGSIAPFGDGYVILMELYNVENGQLHASATTGPQGTLEALYVAAQDAATDLRDKLLPLPKRADRPDETTAQMAFDQPVVQQSESLKSTVIGMIEINSTPPGASVYVSRDEDETGSLEGQTPIIKELLPLTYWVTVRLKNHDDIQRQIRIDPSETITLNLDMVENYPANPYKAAGHVFFWTGLGIFSFGFPALGIARSKGVTYQENLDSSAKHSSQVWAGVMWSSFGFGAALMSIGLWAWLKSPGDKEYYERKKDNPQISLSPTSVIYSRRF